MAVEAVYDVLMLFILLNVQGGTQWSIERMTSQMKATKQW